ncbi:MAG TPA: hypothetical protein VM533_15735 [Fimbriiglobus sp.]|nr:hypothetical protein [Fimbriiglobus sp.]
MRTIVLSLTLAMTAPAAADDDSGPKSDPKGVKLELAITSEKANYPPREGLSAEELKRAAEAGERLPKPPEVALKVVVKNTGDKLLQVWAKGDPVVLTLELKGEGAVNLEPRLAFTREFRIPEAVEVAPGKSLEIPVKSLTSGFRGQSNYSYWTKPGEYTLVATFKTGVQPIPEGAKEQDGFGQVKLTSAPFKVKVK